MGLMRRQIFPAFVILIVAVSVVGGAITFEDGFEDEPADAGVPENWSEGLTISNTVNVSTFRSNTGSQSAFISDGSGSGSITHSVSETTENVSFAIYLASDLGDPDEVGIELDDAGSSTVKLALRNGDLESFDGTWGNVISTVPNRGEWITITIFDIDPAADTYSVEWSTSSDSGVVTGIAMNNGMDSGGYDTMELAVFRSGGYYDDVSVGTVEETATPTAKVAADKPEQQSWYKAYVLAPNLYDDLVLKATVSEPIALLFAGILLGFMWAAIKLRSVIVGGLWLFMVLSFLMALLVDTSLVYFWMAFGLGTIGLVASLVEYGRQ